MRGFTAHIQGQITEEAVQRSPMAIVQQVDVCTLFHAWFADLSMPTAASSRAADPAAPVPTRAAFSKEDATHVLDSTTTKGLRASMLSAGACMHQPHVLLRWKVIPCSMPGAAAASVSAPPASLANSGYCATGKLVTAALQTRSR